MIFGALQVTKVLSTEEAKRAIEGSGKDFGKSNPHRESLKYMPDHGGNRTYDLWNTSPILFQLSYAVWSVRVCDISEQNLVPSISMLLLPSVARQHTILNTRWFLQSPLDPVFRAIYVLSKSRSCVCLSGFRISGEIISFKYLNYFEGGGRESFSIAHACFLPCAREQDEKSRFLKTNGKRWKIFRKIR